MCSVQLSCWIKKATVVVVVVVVAYEFRPNRTQRTRGRQFHQHAKNMLLALLLLNSHECSRKHSSSLAKCVDLVLSLVTVDR